MPISGTVTIATAIRQLTADFHTVSTTPRLDAECLLAHAIQQPRTYLFTYPERTLTDTQCRQTCALVERRLAGEPVAYLVGHQSFWSLELTVNRDTLIPRPETEHLIEWVVATFDTQPHKVADLGTGSGAIALALASERSAWQVHATDQSTAALNIAQQNAHTLGLSNVDFFHGDWCAALPDQNYDLLISNPPYIDANDPHLNDLRYEPVNALVAGDAGTADLIALIQQATDYLRPGGTLILEHGFEQRQRVAQTFERQGFDAITTHRDLAHHSRFTTGRLPTKIAKAESSMN